MFQFNVEIFYNFLFSIFVQNYIKQQRHVNIFFNYPLSVFFNDLFNNIIKVLKIYVFRKGLISIDILMILTY